MNNILTELTAQIVGLFFAYEINNDKTDYKHLTRAENSTLKAGNEVAKAFETILLHSKEATEIERKDRENKATYVLKPETSYPYFQEVI